MNYRSQQKELLYAKIAFYVCMALAFIIGLKGLSLENGAVGANVAGMLGASAAGSASTQISPAVIDPSALDQAQRSVQAASPADSSENGPTSNGSSRPTSGSDDQSSYGQGVQYADGGQNGLIASLIKALPANIAMIRSIAHVEGELTQGDTSAPGQVDRDLAHPSVAAAGPSQQPAGSASTQNGIISMVAQVPGFSSAGQQSLGFVPAIGSLQNLSGELGGVLPSSPWMIAIICFALGLAAPRMFRREDPAVIYRPQVLRMPQIFTPNWQGYAQRAAPDLMRSGSYCQYQPYFVGQELELQPGQPKAATSPYSRFSAQSKRLARNTRRMVRRFLEL